MKKTTVEVTTEEMAMLNQLREQKAQKIKEEEERKVKQESMAALERKFKEATKLARASITEHLRVASEQLEAAVAVSEKTGIPFDSRIVDLGMMRHYQPRSFSKVWEKVPEEWLTAEEIYSNYDSGWEYWSASSLSC